jgi:hypothetical protein
MRNVIRRLLEVHERVGVLKKEEGYRRKGAASVHDGHEPLA